MVALAFFYIRFVTGVAQIGFLSVGIPVESAEVATECYAQRIGKNLHCGGSLIARVLSTHSITIDD